MTADDTLTILIIPVVVGLSVLAAIIQTWVERRRERKK
jgi:hypothetical protein